MRPLGGNERAYGGEHTRFANTPVHKERHTAALRADHPALLASKTIFPKSVRSAGLGGRVLVSGVNNAKIGGMVTKGAWAGMPIYTLTLEERATCPTSCDLLRECYGNTMPLAKRHSYDRSLLPAIEKELTAHTRNHPGGFVVRLHVLGDFPDLNYVDHWRLWLEHYPMLRVFGYTAWKSRTVVGHEIGWLNTHYPDRWRIRFSVLPESGIDPMQATTIWRDEKSPVVTEGNVCPASLDRTWTCGTCALCWSPEMDDKRIVFLGHGMGRKSK